MKNFFETVDSAINGTSDCLNGEVTLTEVHTRINKALIAIDEMRTRLTTIANGIKIHSDEKIHKTAKGQIKFKKRGHPVDSKNNIKVEKTILVDPAEYETRKMKSMTGGYKKTCGYICPRGTWKFAAEDYIKVGGFIVDDIDAANYSKSDPTWVETMIHVLSTNNNYAHIGFWMKDPAIVLNKNLSRDNKRSIASHLAKMKYHRHIPQISIGYSKAKKRVGRKRVANG